MRERKTWFFGYRLLDEKHVFLRSWAQERRKKNKSHWMHFAQSTEMKDSLGMNQEFYGDCDTPFSLFIFILFCMLERQITSAYIENPFLPVEYL